MPERSETAKSRQERREQDRVERNIGRVYRKHGEAEVLRRYGLEGLRVLREKGFLNSSPSDSSGSTASASMGRPPKHPSSGIPELDLERGEVGESFAEKLVDLLSRKKKKES